MNAWCDVFSRFVAVGTLDRKLHLGVVGKIIFKWIFKKWDVEKWTGLLWLRTGTGGGCLLMQ